MSSTTTHVLSDLQALTKAYEFAAIKHVAQRRKSTEIPYINHPIGVANIITTIGDVFDIPTLQAAVLHEYDDMVMIIMM